MEIDLIHKTLSDKRFARYLQRCNNNVGQALKYYEFNSRMAQSCHIALESFEVILRNQIHNTFTKVFKTDEWYNIWLSSDKYSDFHKTIIETKEKLIQQKEDVNPGKMIAEFTLGFWVRMFNMKYENLLWKPLRNAFSELPKNKKKRGTVAKKLNRIRKFRNRISHYEPIAWNVESMYNNHNNIYIVINWISKEYGDWVKARSVFEEVLKEQTVLMKEVGIKKLEYNNK